MNRINCYIDKVLIISGMYYIWQQNDEFISHRTELFIHFRTANSLSFHHFLIMEDFLTPNLSCIHVYLILSSRIKSLHKTFTKVYNLPSGRSMSRYKLVELMFSGLNLLNIQNSKFAVFPLLPFHCHQHKKLNNVKTNGIICFI